MVISLYLLALDKNVPDPAILSEESLNVLLSGPGSDAAHVNSCGHSGNLSNCNCKYLKKFSYDTTHKQNGGVAVPCVACSQQQQTQNEESRLTLPAKRRSRGNKNISLNCVFRQHKSNKYFLNRVINFTAKTLTLPTVVIQNKSPLHISQMLDVGKSA